TTALFPPKASPSLTTTCRSAARLSLGTQSTGQSSSVCRWLMVGGANPDSIAMAQAAAPSALAAPMAWPSIDLIDTVVGTFSPKTLPRAAHSVTSLARVPVPCADTRSTSAGVTPDPSSADSMHRAMPVTSGATGWDAAQDSP